VKRFANEPVLELRRAPVRSQLRRALGELDQRLPLAVPLLIADPSRRATRAQAPGRPVTHSTDPGRPDRVVATAERARPDDVDAAVDAARRGATAWGRRTAAERAQVLVEAAARLRERRLELAALEVRECAKPWPEADADVCEAIDFLEYYARGAIELERGPELLQAPGERNQQRYAPRGVAAVIAPWNFPLAIPAGMTAASLATGNAAVLKPAEQSPACGYELVRALHEAGVPPEALALLPGEGEVGAALVGHADVHTIAFTGSAAVGLEIVERAARAVPGQRHIKRVIAELGGKNCVIVDADADLDEAVPAIVSSAYAYAGQKCSAASRVLVHEALADQLLERLAGAVELLGVGPAEDFDTDVPAVIDRDARERVLGYAERAAAEGEIVARGRQAPTGGWYCRPLLVAGLPADSAVLRDEVFGPLLTVESVAGVGAACDVVDGLPFALTGGLFARNPHTVSEVARRIPVGNLYVNRAITGAMVGRQPFGGNRLSGNGTKAGGPDYLRHFVEPRVLTENTVRHGIVA
jgi:RHH-type proline utilization regulon transcriptional repressor/proline dehydrogenase/delta 1-pyrroline-5-carboxylate dehydrogenase